MCVQVNELTTGSVYLVDDLPRDAVYSANGWVSELVEGMW